MTIDISAKKVWYNGKEASADQLCVWSFSDDFDSRALLLYSLLNKASGETLVNANEPLVISGKDYEIWNTSADGNAYIVNWVLTQLNLKKA